MSPTLRKTVIWARDSLWQRKTKVATRIEVIRRKARDFGTGNIVGRRTDLRLGRGDDAPGEHAGRDHGAVAELLKIFDFDFAVIEGDGFVRNAAAIRGARGDAGNDDVGQRDAEIIDGLGAGYALAESDDGFGNVLAVGAFEHERRG